MKLCFMCASKIKGKIYHLDTEEVCVNCYEKVFLHDSKNAEESKDNQDRTSWLDNEIDYGNV